MLKYGYEPRTVYGVVAAGGTLGILIPPSTPMVLYAFVAETSTGALFMAGVFPGLMLATMFAAYAVWCEIRREKRAGGVVTRPPRATPAEIMASLRKSFWALSLPPFVLGGMYAGVFTATEAAATGALYAFVIAAFIYRTLGWRDIAASFVDAVKTSAMLFLIIIGAALFGHMLTILRVPQEIVEWVAHYEVGVWAFLALVMGLLFLLGLVLESIAIILITTPVLVPVLEHLAINKVWYGILLTINLEMALISPPVALNLLVIKAITKAPMSEINKAAWPYMGIMAVAMAILIIFPEIALWLPRTMNLGR
jgi:C4-dicarboxylate transporter, DctM subunit